MIAITSPHSRPEGESSEFVGLTSRSSSSSPPPPEKSLVVASQVEELPAVVPNVCAVIINTERSRAGDSQADDGRDSRTVLDELVVLLESHFGGRVRVAKLALNPAAIRHGLAGGPTVAFVEPVPLRFGRLTIDVARHEVLVDELPMPLTKSEFDLLSVLVRRPGVVLSRREIVVAAKGPNYPVDDRSIDVQMFNLRRKLGPVGRRLQTVRSVGYRFTADA